MESHLQFKDLLSYYNAEFLFIKISIKMNSQSIDCYFII
jgi:hypothetical protein